MILSGNMACRSMGFKTFLVLPAEETGTFGIQRKIG
jgi:hypothetical protein